MTARVAASPVSIWRRVKIVRMRRGSLSALLLPLPARGEAEHRPVQRRRVQLAVLGLSERAERRHPWPDAAVLAGPAELGHEAAQRAVAEVAVHVAALQPPDALDHEPADQRAVGAA